MGLGIASIGVKDSMSGSFEKLDVPPTLVSFATAIGKANKVVSTEFKKPESTVVLIRPIIDPETGCPNFFSLKANYKKVEQMMEDGMVAAASSVGYGGLAEALFKMGLGNRIGFKMMNNMATHDMFKPMYGSIVLEMVSDAPAGELLGETTADYTFECCGDKLDIAHRGAHHRQPDRPRCAQDRRGKAEGHHPGLPGHQLRVRHRPRLCPRRCGPRGAGHPQPDPR